MAGIILPIDTRSEMAQIASFFLPATQYVQMSRGIFLKQMSIFDLLYQAVYLLALGSIPTVISMLLFKKQVD